MFRRFLVGTSVPAALLVAAALNAQQLPTKVEVPGPSGELESVWVDMATADGQQPLLVAIAWWLAKNVDLPLVLDPPRIVFASPAVIAGLPFEARQSESTSEDGYGTSDPRQAQDYDIIALYDNIDDTVYLPDRWRGQTPTELSILVHEMVHHVQHTAQLRFACPEAREKIAYDAQNRWLQLFGRDLASEFGIDPFILRFSTTCPP